MNDKKMASFTFPAKLFRDFKLKCVKLGVSMNETVTKLIQEFLNKH